MPEAAIADAKEANDNPEIKKLRDDDQAIRSGPIDVKKLHDEAANEAARRRKVVELLEKGVPKTGADFDALGLVMQHGDNFDDYRLACELATASLILGHKDPWLVTATYDRMLLSVGQRQRFGTQMSEAGIRPLDPTGINDRMRLQFRLPRLAEMKAREQEILKKAFAGG